MSRKALGALEQNLGRSVLGDPDAFSPCRLLRLVRPANVAAAAEHAMALVESPNRWLLAVDSAERGNSFGVSPSKVHGASYKLVQSPACTGTKVTVRLGDPDPSRISTSYVERQNLTMRMGMRRFTCLTNGFSKKIENHIASVAIHFMHYG